MIKSKEDFKNKKVLIMGLGTKGGGVASALFAHEHGAKVTITDFNNEVYLKESIEALRDIPAKYVLGKHHESDFQNHDIIIKNPGIKDDNRFIKIANENQNIVETPIGIFSELNARPFIGITGTKGKSFTTSLVNYLLSYFCLKTIAAGNNCVSPLSHLDEDADFVLELSSWQLRELNKHKKSPNIACWLNFFADHLNHYSCLNEYFEDKLNIIKHQSSDDFCILPLNNKRLSALSHNAKRVFFTSEEITSANLQESATICFVKQGFITMMIDGVQYNLISIDNLNAQLKIKHHFELVIASICIVYIYIKEFYPNQYIGGSDLLKALNSYSGLEHRFESVFVNNQITIINDSAASTPESTIFALQACKHKPIVLIAGGGGHKNLSFVSLANEIVNTKTHVILFNNDNTSKILSQLFSDLNYNKFNFVDSLENACNIAYNLVQNMGGSLLLSPACSGAPYFKDMFERGTMFKNYIYELLNEY